ncbi:4055_t:CDS:2 [Ambispora gerdemannii]|uniref:4055_t:CDS:1 n=1 Tax=Ambispora gerdemannii TaxID=144530 RepID=A0A9N8ZTD8_9GLOM|nr:4055_t:CDS:2 [Ambispora gerdemannii]
MKFGEKAQKISSSRLILGMWITTPLKNFSASAIARLNLEDIDYVIVNILKASPTSTASVSSSSNNRIYGYKLPPISTKCEMRLMVSDFQVARIEATNVSEFHL